MVILSIIIFGFIYERKTDAQFILTQYEVSDTFNRIKKSHPDSIKYSKGYTAYLNYDKNESLKKIYGNIVSLDTPLLYGHIFNFDTLNGIDKNHKLGRLTSYGYLSPISSPYSYAVEFNAATKKYTEIFNPFLDYSIYDFSDKDSILKYTLQFSTFPRANISASFSYDSKIYKKLSLSKSDYMPFLVGADLKINKSVDHIFLKIEAKDLLLDLPGLSNSRTFVDTVTLK